MANPGAKAPEACFLAMYRGYRGNCFGGRGPFCPRNTRHCRRAHCAGLLPGVQIAVGSAVASSGSARISAAIHPGPVQAELLTHGLLSGCRPKQPCRLEPFIRNAISRDKSVHEPIVRRPAHPRRLVGVLVIGRVAAKPQAQLASAPEGSGKLSLSLGGVGKLVSAPRPKVTAAARQVQLAHPPVQLRAHEPPSQPTEMWAGGCEIDFVVNLERFARPVVCHFVFQANPVVPGTTDMSFAFHVEVVVRAGESDYAANAGA